jgi:hypothetical protein
MVRLTAEVIKRKAERIIVDTALKGLRRRVAEVS